MKRMWVWTETKRKITATLILEASIPRTNASAVLKDEGESRRSEGYRGMMRERFTSCSFGMLLARKNNDEVCDDQEF